MIIKLLDNLSERSRLTIGAVLELPDSVCLELIATGKAERYDNDINEGRVKRRATLEHWETR